MFDVFHLFVHFMMQKHDLLEVIVPFLSKKQLFNELKMFL